MFHKFSLHVFIVWPSLVYFSAIIEDLKGYKDLTEGLNDGVFDPRAALRIADYTLKLHTNSHKCHLSTEEFSKLMDDFRYYIPFEITSFT